MLWDEYRSEMHWWKDSLGILAGFYVFLLLAPNIWSFQDKKRLQICKVLQITKMISFFYLSGNNQNTVAICIPLIPIPIYGRMFENVIINILQIRNSICKILQIWKKSVWWMSQVAGTMVALSSSVGVIGHSNLSKVPPVLKHVGKCPVAMSAVKRLASVAPEVNLG